MANRGGFSWKRALGVTKAKRKISKATRIPLTKSGRQRKVGKMATGGGCLLPILLIVLLIPVLVACGVANTPKNVPSATVAPKKPTPTPKTSAEIQKETNAKKAEQFIIASLGEEKDLYDFTSAFIDLYKSDKTLADVVIRGSVANGKQKDQPESIQGYEVTLKGVIYSVNSGNIPPSDLKAGLKWGDGPYTTGEAHAYYERNGMNITGKDRTYDHLKDIESTNYIVTINFPTGQEGIKLGQRFTTTGTISNFATNPNGSVVAVVSANSYEPDAEN